jgi:hypothetical protein
MSHYSDEIENMMDSWIESPEKYLSPYTRAPKLNQFGNKSEISVVKHETEVKASIGSDKHSRVKVYKLSQR